METTFRQVVVQITQYQVGVVNGTQYDEDYAC